MTMKAIAVFYGNSFPLSVLHLNEFLFSFVQTFPYLKK